MNHEQTAVAQRSAEWRGALERDGYVVVPSGVPAGLLAAVVDDIWRHCHASPDDADSWYQPEIVRPSGGMVEMYHYQSMWDVRQHPSLHAAFAAVHGTDELWVSIDRVAFKPPVRDDRPDYDQGGFIHWDSDMSRYPDIPFGVQGVLALADTDADMGGFQCVPDIFRDQQRFLDAITVDGTVPHRPDIGDHPVVKVALRAGEIAIWRTTMLHGNGRNTSTRPRLAQYVTMNPPPADAAQRDAARAGRVASWSGCAPPDRPAFPGDPRRIEEDRGRPAELTDLGRRLLGLDDWT